MQVFDFDNGIEASPGWSTGGGDLMTYAFTKKEGSTPSTGTGPSAGVGGSGPYVYAETSSPRVQGDLFTLTYDGSACSNIGLSVSTVTFHYHMYGATMGTLDVTNAAGEVVWSLSGDQGDAWQATTVDVYSPSFAFEYTRGSSYTGDAAVALVAVSCGAVYKLMNEALSWNDAHAACLAAGLQLASVQSASENARLVTAAAGNRVWIGGTDAASEGTWKWSSTGTPLSYTNWNSKEPNDWGGNEDCVEVNSSGKWNDCNCAKRFKFVCDRRS